MVLGGGKAPASPAGSADTPAEVAWHDIECGSYRVDLPLWRELAEQARGPVLDVGAGSGRVAIELARAGHEVTALDLSGVLLAALRERAGPLPIETVGADARAFELGGKRFGLCVVPMQTIQLLGGADGRRAFLRCARAHLQDGATLACALLEDVEPFDCAAGDVGPAAETGLVDGRRYISRATRVAQLARSVVIERERGILDVLAEAGNAPARFGARAGELELNVVELDRVSAPELQREAVQAGLQVEETRAVPATDEHVGSVVVVLSA